ncbi:mobilization relaxase [Jannaschia sp. 2305UL9-9]|uniref:mobilization relaxase n=1 Tax=Jannaschia sp. 2305UL9-9 TaxID=3121638 RepID=UPI003529AA19
MLIKFFSNGKGAGAGPVGYLVSDTVLAYDENRDLIRDADGEPMSVTRDPRPEVLRGDPTRTEALIDASRNHWTYRAGVISFATADAPDEVQQTEVMDAFERLAFAGLEAEQYDMLWVRHTHENRVELHFCTPRLELTSGRSLNIAPPGYQNAFDSLRDLMNKTHGWADPMELERAQEVRGPTEATHRAQGRDELHAWILDQVSVGLIGDRASMIDALTDAGFEIPRAGKAYLTAQDPDNGERWRLKGEIFHETWQADTSEREAERGRGRNSTGARRLDGFTVGELQGRYDQHCTKRAEYNRDRYPAVRGAEQELAPRPDPSDQRLRDDIALADPLDRIGWDRNDDGGEHVLGGDYDAIGDRADGIEPDRAGQPYVADHGPLPDRIANLHAGERASDVPQNQGEIDVDGPDSIGKRLARIRRAVGDGLREFDRRLERIRGTLDRWDAEPDGWLGRLLVGAHSVARGINDSVTRLVERGIEFQRSQRSVEDQLELTEGRREAAEQALDAARELSRSDGRSR